MAKRKKSGAAVSKKEAAALAKKLDAWGATLTAKERAVLQVLVSKAGAVKTSAINVTQARPRLTEAIRQVFVDMVDPGAASGAWVKMGPVWSKVGNVPRGEEVEIVGKVVVKGKTG